VLRLLVALRLLGDNVGHSRFDCVMVVLIVLVVRHSDGLWLVFAGLGEG
jgi:hypothetical protein